MEDREQPTPEPSLRYGDGLGKSSKLMFIDAPQRRERLSAYRDHDHRVEHLDLLTNVRKAKPRLSSRDRKIAAPRAGQAKN